MFYPRILQPKLMEYLTLFPVVGVMGPRQSGKSTVLLQILPDYEYVSFDEFRIINFLKEDPEGFMQRYSSKIIFDEVQKAPEIFHHVKSIVDKNRNQKGQFVLTGSSQFGMMKGVSESLAGRIGLLTLLPFQYAEIPDDLRNDALWQGSYPELVCRQYDHREDWYSAYVDTYLNKDVREISQIGDLRDFQRFMKLLAAHTSQIFNQSHYARDLGISVPTIKRWISILEASYVVFLLQPYHENRGKRLVKSPKIYFYDTGIVTYLTGIETEKQYEQGPMSGAIFENYVIAEIIKKDIHQKKNSEFYYLRTTHGVEIDLLKIKGEQKEWIEIKKTATFRPNLIQTLKLFIEEKDKGTLVYNGKTDFYNHQISMKNIKDYLL